ncbi:MAG: L-rhamnose mutarotase [Spirochaetales bacterium]|nr:L-rhamnose mutarotase [Spirochaetales bacterium]
MEVICELMRLRPERVKDYRDMHDHTWPELVAAIRDSGFLEEYIYMLDNLVIVIMKCEDFQDSVRRLTATAVYQRWTKDVRGMLVEDRQLFGTDEKIVDLSPIWDLSKL